MELYEHIKPPPQTDKPLYTTFGGHTYADMYPHSPNDSPLWLELFMLAAKVDVNLAKQFEIIRTTGAWLLLDQQYGFRIQPIIDPKGANGWTTMEQYNAERRYLMPYMNNVVEALRELRRRFDAGLIR